MILLTNIKKDILSNYSGEFWDCLRHNSLNTNITKIIVFSDTEIKNIHNIQKVSFITKSQISDRELYNFSNANSIIKSDPFVKFHHDLKKISDLELKSFILVGDGFEIFSRFTKSDLISKNRDKSKPANIYTVRKKIVSKKIKPQITEPEKTTSQFGTATISDNKLDVVILSVDYNDFLILTLAKNIQFFENITVITTKEDLVCQQICNKLGVKFLTTDAMYRGGSKFNKGAAMEFAIKSLDNPEFILLLDCDIIIKNPIDVSKLECDVLYTKDRVILEDYQTWLSYQKNGVEFENSQINPDERGLGFFQLFHIDSKCIDRNSPYPTDSGDASWTDLKFRDKFQKRVNLGRCVHLGSPYKNWSGRLTSEFIEVEEFSKLFQKISMSGINSYFDNIYCLNLDRRTDRWIEMSKKFQSWNMSVERFSAIDGENLPDEEIYIPTEIENKYSLCCLRSHRNIILDAKDKNYDKILIFEDDVIFDKDFEKKLKQIKKIFWKLLYLGASQFDWKGIKIKDGFYNCKKTLGTFAYAIDRSMYDIILEATKLEEKPIDHYLSNLQENNNQYCFSFFPHIVISNVTNSEIRDPKKFDDYARICKWNLENFNLEENGNNPKKSISIIVPCYNQSKFLIECVDSCLNQTIVPSEIVVLLMDEKSIDLSNILQKKSTIIKCIESEKMFLSEARNKLVSLVTSDYFIPLDADDTLPENFLEEVSKINADVVYVGSKYFGSKNGTWPDPINEEIDWTKLTTFRRNSLVCTALIKRQSFIESGLYNEKLWAFEDMALWIKMFEKKFDFKKCFNTHLNYRKHETQSSLLVRATSSEENKKELKDIIMTDVFYKRTPKIIHYVWIGDKKFSSEILNNWKKYLPESEWTYMFWNEENFDMSSSKFLQKSYQLKKYGICVDYIRAKVLYEWGGVWLDTDCVINDDISPFLQYDFFSSWENENFINIGLIGCSPRLEQIKNILNFYTDIDPKYEVLNDHFSFVKEIGTGPIILTNEILKTSNIRNGGFTKEFTIDDKKFLIETPDVFVIDDRSSGRINYAVHLFEGSWTEKKEKWSDVVKLSYDQWKSKNNI